MEWPPDWSSQAQFGQATSARPRRLETGMPGTPKVSHASAIFSPETPESETSGTQNIVTSPVCPRHPVFRLENLQTSEESQYYPSLTEIAAPLALPETVVLTADRIVQHVRTDDSCKLHGVTFRLFLRAALFIACRQLGVVKTFKEFEVDLQGKQKSWFHKQFRTIESVLKKDVFTLPQSPTSQAPSDETISPTQFFPTSFTIIDFIESISKALYLNDIIRDRALGILKVPEIADLIVGKRPGPWAASVTSFAAEAEEYYIGTEPYAKASGTSFPSVANAQKLLMREVEALSKTGPLPKPLQARWNTKDYQI